tara:strand:+ start:275 stop:475 length:201 start_codon:yes stop_codon:yes gene_type:complete
MDFFKELIRLNNEIELKKISIHKYTIDSDEEEDDIILIKGLRDTFIQEYNKVNNRQFELKRPQKIQ